MLTSREQRILDELVQHRNELESIQLSDFQHIYDQWVEKVIKKMPTNKRITFFQGLDKGLFHLHSYIQGASFQNEARDRIINRAKAFYEEVERLEDLKKLGIDQLIYLANNEIAKHRVYSFAQGGVTGLGGFVLSMSDLPMMAAINLRITQLIGMCYGYDQRIPYEMMISLKVFHGGTLPIRLQHRAWNDVLTEVMEREDDYFYVGEEQLTDYTWLEQPMRQVMKIMCISQFKKKVIQGIPIIGVGIGSITNYQLTKQVTTFANRFYQYRFLQEKIKTASSED
ncbi:MAG: EcsC family protein [Bacillaceae bacterium]